ncbi:hypothetical protein ACROYT_G015168 [Oculina patagonica]
MEYDSAEQHAGQMDTDNESESDPELELESESESDYESNAANEPIRAFTSSILKFCLIEMLKDEQHGAVFRFVDTVAALQMPVQCSARRGQLRNIQQELSHLEIAFPVSLQVVLLHLIQHLPASLESVGDIHSIAMFAIERYQHFFVSHIHNKR